MVNSMEITHDYLKSKGFTEVIHAFHKDYHRIQCKNYPFYIDIVAGNGMVILKNDVSIDIPIAMGVHTTERLENIYESLTGNTLKSIEEFDTLLKADYQSMSNMCWTKTDICKHVAEFLTGQNGKILDVGSGVGKFCITGGYIHSNHQFVGVEQKKNYIEDAEKIVTMYGLTNVKFIHGDFKDLDLSEYGGIYLFNPFVMSHVDSELSRRYPQILYNLLETMKSGSRLVTYCYSSSRERIPTSFEFVSDKGGQYFWIKK